MNHEGTPQVCIRSDAARGAAGVGEIKEKVTAAAGGHEVFRLAT
jgi:hypothetical protein